MSSRRRFDHAGTFHHVTNRGLAHRPTFDTVHDVRFWLYLMAQCAKRGWLEIHAFCLMTTHFHMLVLSLMGRLSHAMQWAASQFTRAFNRRRGRDGPLWKGKFYSRPLRDPTDRFMVARYIDRNPLEAGLVEGVCDWPHGSAWHYGRRQTGPPWLTRREIEKDVCATLGLKAYDPARYGEVFGREQHTDEAWLVERRIDTPHVAETAPPATPATPEWARGWLLQQTTLADGDRPGFPLAAPDTLLDSLAMLLPADRPWRVGRHRRRFAVEDVVVPGLLRSGAGLTFKEIALRQGCTPSTVHRRHQLHCELLERDASYADLAARALSAACPQDSR